MTRAQLKLAAQTIAAALHEKSYDHWFSQDLPISYGTEFEGEDIFVEISELSKSDQRLELCVSVNAGGWSNYFPASGYAQIFRAIGGKGDDK